MIRGNTWSHQLLLIFPIFSLFGETNLGILIFLALGSLMCLLFLISAKRLIITPRNSILVASAFCYALASATFMQNFYGLVILLLAILANHEIKPGLFVISIFNIATLSSLIFIEWYLLLGKNSISTFLTVWACYNFIFFKNHRRLVLIIAIFVKLMVYQHTESDVLLITSLICLVGLLLSFNVLNRLRYAVAIFGFLGGVFVYAALLSSGYLGFIVEDPRVGLYIEFIDSFWDILTFNYVPSFYFNLYTQFHNPFLNILHWGGFIGLPLIAFILIRSFAVMSRGNNLYSIVVALLLARAITDSVVLYTPEGLLFYSFMLSNRQDSV